MIFIAEQLSAGHNYLSKIVCELRTEVLIAIISSFQRRKIFLMRTLCFAPPLAAASRPREQFIYVTCNWRLLNMNKY